MEQKLKGSMPDYLLVVAIIAALLVGYLASGVELSRHNDESFFHIAFGGIIGFSVFVSVLFFGQKQRE
jgi:uncharacterized membrane protein (DUF441 family)